jgi:DNA processing protein
MDDTRLPPPPALDLGNLLLLHALPAVGKRRVFELVQRAPFLLAEPVSKDFWLFVEKELHIPVSRGEQQGAQSLVRRVQEQLDRGEFALVHWFGEEYPPLLRQIYDPPLLLFIRGNPALLRGDCLAVVGARNATDYGVTVAREFAARLAEAGLVIVSGMAKGIDSAAHLGALKAGGRTLAVLGAGVDVIYPRQAGFLYRRLCGEGCVASEFFPGIWPAPQNFPVRNRLISGLSWGTVIVEATPRSGSLITARLALEHNRELFAVPGPVHSPLSVGPNYLIKQGAKLVQLWQDVAEELPAEVRARLHWQPGAVPSEPSMDGRFAGDAPNEHLTKEEDVVYKSLFFDRKVHLDALLAKTRLNMGQLGAVLLRLQFAGLIQELPGQYFLKNVR